MCIWMDTVRLLFVAMACNWEWKKAFLCYSIIKYFTFNWILINLIPFTIISVTSRRFVPFEDTTYRRQPSFIAPAGIPHFGGTYVASTWPPWNGLVASFADFVQCSSGIHDAFASIRISLAERWASMFTLWWPRSGDGTDKRGESLSAVELQPAPWPQIPSSASTPSPPPFGHTQIRWRRPSHSSALRGGFWLQEISEKWFRIKMALSRVLCSFRSVMKYIRHTLCEQSFN